MASLGSYKLSPAQHWDSYSNPYGFNDWIKEMSSLVRTLKKGDILENFLDEKLKRVAKHSSLMSKVLLDDEDFHNDAITAIIGEAERSSTSILVTTQTLGAARAEHKYKDFDPESSCNASHGTVSVVSARGMDRHGSSRNERSPLRSWGSS